MSRTKSVTLFSQETINIKASSFLEDSKLTCLHVVSNSSEINRFVNNDTLKSVFGYKES